MPLPEKDYFSLEEIAERWDTTVGRRVRYYAEHGLLEVQVWLGEQVVKTYHLKKTEDGELVPVQDGVKPYNGYAVMEMDELRKVFRFGSRPVDKFKSHDRTDMLKICDKKIKYTIDVNDLVVSRQERDRFEAEHQVIRRVAESAVPAFQYQQKAPSFAGRPTVMHTIIQHLEERIAQHLICESLQKESDYLVQWATHHLSGHQIPKHKSIMNAIRDIYRDARVAKNAA